MKTKTCHMAAKVNQDGGVSPACAKTPRAIDLRKASWTNRREVVTCKRCLAVTPEAAPEPKPLAVAKPAPAVLSEAEQRLADARDRRGRLAYEARARSLYGNDFAKALGGRLVDDAAHVVGRGWARSTERRGSPAQRRSRKS